jgi:nucleotide-binding universal stress UspA family protein
MYDVLVCVDEDEDRATRQAETVVSMPLEAEKLNVSVMHVFEDNPSGASVSQVGSVRRVREHVEDAGIDVELLETSGDPAPEIVEAAEEHEVDLVVLAGRKRSATGKLLFGSVTQEVLLDLARPVLVCGSRDEAESGDED